MSRDYLEYLRIPYKHAGKDFTGCDCFGLLQLFYKNEFGIVLPDTGFDYQEDWWVDNNYLVQLYKEYGFKRVTQDFCFGDVIFFNNNNHHPGHIGIVLDESNFIHLARGGGNIACYGYGVWQRQLHSVYRRKKTGKHHETAV